MRRLAFDFRSVDTRPIELVYCCLTLGWGLFLLGHSPSFSTSASFGPMRSVMSETCWGCLAISIGLCRAYGLAFDRIVCRLAAAMGGGAIWTFSWVTMLMVEPTTGVPVYGVLSMVNFAIFIKLCRSHWVGR